MSDQPAQKPSRKATFALVLASLSLVLSLISCGFVAVTWFDDFDDSFQSPPQAASVSEVEAFAHVTFPPGTVFLSAASSNGLETYLSARFRIPRDALDTFIADGNFGAKLTPGLRAVTKQDDVGGGDTWHPETAVRVSGLDEEAPGPNGTYRRLLADLDAEDTVTMYLRASRP
ncbi:hypothetical protein [Micromonospora palomenae]|uniref:hypothetical protein n=1 Tax=Micromonospora palomenae TaxID=1461247 RepID=UPI0012B75CB8|nr:hypothetical protein [Micromonospora palomenae]